MKKNFLISALFFLLIPLPAQAQDIDVNKMMEQMAEVSNCMGKIDREKMAQLEESARQMEREISQLCQAGKRDEAQKKALSHAKKIAADPAVQQIKRCSELLPEMALPDLETALKDAPAGHICDEVQ
ncbi:MAG: hypothetical protein ABFR97_11465 [Thermodesulfobacteriota bacterium]